MIEEEIFKRSKPDLSRLLAYGFKKENNQLIFKKKILSNTFEIIISINEDNKVMGKVFEIDVSEEYLAFRIEGNVGEFASKIRNNFENTLLDIKEKCFIEEYFIFKQSNRIAKLIKERYQIEPEFLWKDDNKNAVFRNINNKKWIGIIMNINKNKLTDEDKEIEALNVKIDSVKIPLLLEKNGIYKAYHMNKKNWITISLDDTLSDQEIMEYIVESYSYTVTTNEWVVPANPKYYDIVNCFNDTNYVNWKQSSNINDNDIVYLYVGAPYSCIMFKCVVKKANIPYSYSDENLTISNSMELELLESYPHDLYTFKEVSKYGLNAIRGPRRMPKPLLDYMNEK